MKLPRSPRIQPTGQQKVDDALRIIWEEIARVLNGNLSFGGFPNLPGGGGGGVGPNGTPENMLGSWWQGTTAVADTDFTVQHDLGRVPTGWLLFYINKAGIVYEGVTPWTDTQIFLRCNTATTELRLFVV